MEQHDYIVLLEKFFKKEASSEERRILIEWIRKPGIRNEFNLLCEQMWKEAAVKSIRQWKKKCGTSAEESG